MLKIGKTYRSLLFPSRIDMKDAIKFILQSQDLPLDRLEQYRYLRSINLQSDAADCSVVKHRLTNELFIRKIISKTSN